MAEKGGCSMEILDRSRIGLPPNSARTSVIPLSFLDIPWILCHPMQRLIFYDAPHYSALQFTRTALPSLKRSLSLALQEFFPLAGGLACPPPPGKPHIVCSDGDSVSFSAAVSDGDFDELTGDRPQAALLVHPLLPPLPPPLVKDGIRVAPLLAVQVTLFPDRGICIGVQFLHVAADGTAFSHFLKAWASICMAGLEVEAEEGDGRTRIEERPSPVLDRGVVKDLDGLEPILLKQCFSGPNPSPSPIPLRSPSNEWVRATFTLSRAAIDRLKSWVVNNSTTTSDEPLHISTFVAVCAYTWVCLIRCKEISGNNDLFHFGFPADCRSRLGYPIPETYFGNCLVPGIVALERDMLVGTQGAACAALAIGAKVKELSVGGGALKGVKTWVPDLRNMTNVLAVAGSPRQRVYEMNFGWGRPRKVLLVHIDASESISLLDSRDEEGGVEVGLALDKVTMPTFSALFQNGFDSI